MRRRPVDLSVFSPTATRDDVTRTGSSDAAGEIFFPYLPPDTYEMGFLTTVDFENDERLTLDATVDPTNVTVGAGENGTVEYTITAASCGPIPPEE